MKNPQGTRPISPGLSVSGFVTAAARSNPAACSVILAGRGRPLDPGARLISTLIGRLKSGSPTNVSDAAGAICPKAGGWQPRGLWRALPQSEIRGLRLQLRSGVGRNRVGRATIRAVHHYML